MRLEANRIAASAFTLTTMFCADALLPARAAESEYTAKISWEPQGLSGGGAMFAPAISPVDPRRMMVNCDMSAAYVSRDAGRTWRMIHHAQLGSNTRCRPAFHPKEAETIFAAGGWYGGLRVSRDGGETWSKIGNLPEGLTGEIAIDAQQPDSMLVGVEKAVWRSADGGQVWEKCDGVTGEAVAFCFGPGPGDKRLQFAATSEGIWRSDDGGKTWTPKTAGLPSKQVRGFAGGFDPKRKLSRLYCAVPSTRENGNWAGGVYRSLDRGENWEPVPGRGLNKAIKAFDEWSQNDIAQYYRVLTTDVAPLTVYAFNANTGIPPPHHTAAYRSDDGGDTFRPTFFPDPRWPGYNVEPDYTTVGAGQYFQSIPLNVAICATDPDIVIQVDAGNCIITTNGGKNWYNGHSRAAAQKGYFECTGLVVTTTWNYYLDPFQPDRRYICYTDIGFAHSLDAGRSWHWWSVKEQAPWRNTCYELAFDPDTPGKIWGAFSDVHDIPNDNIISGRHNPNGPGGVCASTDFAEHWTVSNQGLPVAPCTSIVLDPRSPKGRRTLYAGVFDKGVFKSVDDGKSWSGVSDGLGSARNRRVCRVVLHKDGTLFALITALRQGNNWEADGVGLWASRDEGKSWRRVSDSQPLSWPKDVTVDPADSRHILIGAANARPQQQGGLYRTRDGGKTWSRIAQKGPEHFGGYFSPFHKGWIYATLTEGAPDAGLWLSRDDGKTWEPFQALPFSNIQRVTFDAKNPSVIYVTTFGGSVWKGPATPEGK